MKLIAVAAILALGGGQPDLWPFRPAPENTVPVPVLTASPTVGAFISACMYAGARPRTYPVLGVSCKAGAERCTAFIALPLSESEVIIPTYSLANPPVEATSEICERPEFRPTGGQGIR